MKKLIVVILVLLFSASIACAAGWSGLTRVTGVQADNAGFTVYTQQQPANLVPTTCTNKQTFYFMYNDGPAQHDRMYNAIRDALRGDRQIRFYITNTCNQWGQPKISAVHYLNKLFN
jgi:hypothetical protein